MNFFLLVPIIITFLGSAFAQLREFEYYLQGLLDALNWLMLYPQGIEKLPSDQVGLEVGRSPG